MILRSCFIEQPIYGDVRGHAAFLPDPYALYEEKWCTNASLQYMDAFLIAAVMLGHFRVGLPMGTSTYSICELVEKGYVGLYKVPVNAEHDITASRIIAQNRDSLRWHSPSDVTSQIAHLVRQSRNTKPLDWSNFKIGLIATSFNGSLTALHNL